MPVVIRLARAGTKKRPFYHVVVADSRSPRDGRFIERLGYFNPLLPKDKKERLVVDFEKVKTWLSKGAQPSDRAGGPERPAGLGVVQAVPDLRHEPVVGSKVVAEVVVLREKVERLGDVLEPDLAGVTG